MSDNKQRSSDFTLTPGRLLSDARSARAFSQEDIAKQMRLSVQAIQDIEDDHYKQFAAPTFVRGHLRTFAKLVGVSEVEIIQALEASQLMPSEPALKPTLMEGASVVNVTRQSTSSGNPRLIAGSIAVVVIVGLAIAWSGQKSDVTLAKQEQDKIKATVAQINTAQTTQSLTLPQEMVAPTAPVANTSTTPIATVKKHSGMKLVWTKKNDIVMSSHTLKPTYTLSPVKKS